jgi:hypothetical protein
MEYAAGEEPGDGGKDLLLIYETPYDSPFARLLGGICQDKGLSLLSVCQEDVEAKLEELRAERRPPRVCLNLAAGAEASLLPVEEWANEHISNHLNPSERRRKVWRKTYLHWQFIRSGIDTPYTIPIPSWKRAPHLTAPAGLWRLGVPFSAKPDLGGGGWEVVTDASLWEHVQEMRRRIVEHDLILQELVEPVVLGGKRAWFRVLYACGAAVPCWWDDHTHFFGDIVSEEERLQWGLEPLWRIAQIAAEIAGLQVFSTEVALAVGGRFVVVDYVNDPVDLRFRPHALEGMPHEAARILAEAIAAYLSQPMQDEINLHDGDG